jgi:hemerythrin-like domain-containing protein
MNTATSFTALSKCHDELERLFDRHQRALLASDIDRAVATLAKFGAELEHHIDFEERRLLPLYADQGAETAGGTLQIFQAEHRKLRDSAADLTRRIQLLHASADTPGDILALLDQESAFKRLFRHHAAREKKLLFPRLDERATEEERRTWLSDD